MCSKERWLETVIQGCESGPPDWSHNGYDRESVMARSDYRQFEVWRQTKHDVIIFGISWVAYSIKFNLSQAHYETIFDTIARTAAPYVHPHVRIVNMFTTNSQRGREWWFRYTTNYRQYRAKQLATLLQYLLNVVAYGRSRQGNFQNYHAVQEDQIIITGNTL